MFGYETNVTSTTPQPPYPYAVGLESITQPPYLYAVGLASITQPPYPYAVGLASGRLYNLAHSVYN